MISSLSSTSTARSSTYLFPETEGTPSFSRSRTHAHSFYLIWCFLIDYRTGESRGFAFVRYKYADEAQKAVEKLDGLFLVANSIDTSTLVACLIYLFINLVVLLVPIGKIVDGREIMVQFAKYGPNAERM